MNRQTVLKRLRESRPVIAPSMLKCDFANLQRDVALLEAGGADVLHLDVMDGHFVPNLSYGPMVIQRMRELTSLPFDAHLMIVDPGRYLDDFIDAGCNCITFHLETVCDPLPLLERIRSAEVAAGVALSPATPISAVEPLLGACDLILVMSVEPGFGGQSFIPEVLTKVRYLAEHRAERPLISIDGGVGRSTIGPAAQAGADVFVAGSAIFESCDYAQAIEELRRRAASETSAA